MGLLTRASTRHLPSHLRLGQAALSTHESKQPAVLPQHGQKRNEISSLLRSWLSAFVTIPKITGPIPAKGTAKRGIQRQVAEAPKGIANDE